MKLNKKRPFGTISGKHEIYPTAMFQQDGAMFNAKGECLSLDGKKKYVKESKEAKTAEKEQKDKIDNAGNELMQMAKALSKLSKKIIKAEKKLSTAKDSDITLPAYTSDVSEAQKNLTNLRREHTNLNKKAAVLEAAATADVNDED